MSRQVHPPEARPCRLPSFAAGLALPLLLLLLPWATCPESSAAPPEIDALEPRALTPGATNSLRVRGRNLESVHSLWTSWLGVVGHTMTDGGDRKPDQLEFPIPVPPRHPLGVEMVRLIATNGVSAPFLLLIDDLPATPGVPDSGSIDRAQALAPGTAVDAVCLERRPQFYRIPAREGQSLSLEIVANRTGSPVDPALRVLDASGRELAYAQDTPGLGLDCAVDFKAPVAGDYILEVRDAEFAGGGDYRYRLRVGTFPLAVLPAAGIPGASQGNEIAWESALTPRTGRARWDLSSTGVTATVRMRVRGRANAHALNPRLPSDAIAPAREVEPNDTPETATAFDWHGVVQGRFGVLADQDWYRLELTEAGRWRFEIQSRRLGLPCDPLLRLVDDQGKILASAASDALDAVIQYRFDRPGTCYLVAEEAAERFGPGRSYRLVASPAAPGFSVTSEIERINVPVGGTESLKIDIQRLGYDGPVRFEVEGLPPELSLENPGVEAKKKEGELKLHCAASARPGLACMARILARPVDQEQAAPAPLNLAPAMRKAFPKVLAMPPGFADAIWVCVIPTPSQPARE